MVKSKVLNEILGVGLSSGFMGCKLIDNPYVAGNVCDSFLTAGFYFGLRMSFSGYASAFIAGGCASLAELCQHIGLCPGTYDPKDFIAYGAGVGLAVTIDKLISIRKKSLDIVIEQKGETPC